MRFNRDNCPSGGRQWKAPQHSTLSVSRSAAALVHSVHARYCSGLHPNSTHTETVDYLRLLLPVRWGKVKRTSIALGCAMSGLVARFCLTARVPATLHVGYFGSRPLQTVLKISFGFYRLYQRSPGGVGMVSSKPLS